MLRHNTIDKIKKKISTTFRRLRLGKRLKHQYICHPHFGFIRNKNDYTITWDNQIIAHVGKVSSLKDKFSASSFIIATGPSLNTVDLTKAKHFDTISLNCAIRRFSENNLIPTHCLIVDHRVFENHWDCVRESILSGSYCYFSYVGLSRICEREPDLLKRDNIFLIENIRRKFGIERLPFDQFRLKYSHNPDIFIDHSLKNIGGNVGFSTSADEGFFSGKTVATWAVQLAYYLGYRKQFIVGMDLGGTGKSHFYNNGNNRPPDFMKDYEPFIRVSFEQALRASKQLEFSIYNLSEQSSLPHEIIPKISYDEALSIAKNDPKAPL